MKNIFTFVMLSLLLIKSPLVCLGVPPKGEPVILSEQDSLSYLVKKSDLIAVIKIDNGTYKERILSLKDMPKEIEAKVISVTKGQNVQNVIKIINTPKYLQPKAIKSFIVLRNGLHLAFLIKEGDYYKPTTRFSLLDISNNKVYPIWEQVKNGNGVTAGYLLDLVISEIQMEIEFAQ